LDILKERGVSLDKQRFTWKELAGPPYSKLDDDAFTRVRVILMNGLMSDGLRFLHVFGRRQRDLRVPLAEIRRVTHHQQTMVNWLNPADQSPLETTIGFEQVAIEVTAALAQQEPDPYLAQSYRFGLLEDFDHLYRFSALLDRLEGKDANNILQSYTDIQPGRPTVVEHRAPVDDVRRSYDRSLAQPLTKLNALTLVASEYQTHDFYMNLGPTYADPVARMVYAEIASIEEQHVTQYESLLDPDETWLEQWLLHEAMQLYNYYSCAEQETNPRIKAIWERFVDYELGQLHAVGEILQRVEGRDVAELLPAKLPDPIPFESQRDFVRETLEREVDLRSIGPDYVPGGRDSEASREYREHLNQAVSPTTLVAAGYRWTPGTELVRMAAPTPSMTQGSAS
jgi:hypothetical protein